MRASSLRAMARAAAAAAGSRPSGWSRLGAVRTVVVSGGGLPGLGGHGGQPELVNMPERGKDLQGKIAAADCP